MINALIANGEPRFVKKVSNYVLSYCPQIVIHDNSSTCHDIFKLLRDREIDLLFLDVEIAAKLIDIFPEIRKTSFEIILIHSLEEKAIPYLGDKAIGHLIRPVDVNEFILTVQHAIFRLQMRREFSKNREILQKLLQLFQFSDQISIPTMEGMDFIPAEKILRCEGLNRFTRVFKTDGSSIISSYNIGEFCKFLQNYGFFAPHKSHLVNLQHMVRYSCEGTIIMRDGSTVPVSRRRKSQFMDWVRHI